jgi:hypothetical protein
MIVLFHFDQFFGVFHVFSNKCHLRNASHASGPPIDNYANPK